MFVTYYSRSFRRRYCLIRVAFILACIYLFIQIKYIFIDLLSTNNSTDTISPCTNIYCNKTLLNCTGDPLKQWCDNYINSCNSSLIIYNQLFIRTHNIILQPKYAKGKRIGGEEMKDVLNQAESDEYFHFEKEFIKLPCNIPKLAGLLPDDHISKIFSTLVSYEKYSNVEIINETTIAVNRHDYVNIYHTVTDLYTVYLLCRFFQRDPKLVRILFLDSHPKGNLDIFWSQLFHSYTRLGHLKNTSSSFLYKELIWSQTQSKSEIDIQKHRLIAPSFYFDFRQHILKQFNINYNDNNKIDCQLINIFFLSRHNYIAHPRNPTGKISRQITNEKQILEKLQIKFSNYININFTYNHFEQLSIKEQLNIMIQTDILVGMHGAGLTHVLFLKKDRTLIELATSGWKYAIHYELFASMNNCNYHRCLINSVTVTEETIFDCIKGKISEMCPSINLSMNNNQIIPKLSTILGNISNSTNIKT